MCVAERLYEVEHPPMVKEFDAICDIPNDSPGFWISKKWLRGMFDLVLFFYSIDRIHEKRLEISET